MPLITITASVGTKGNETAQLVAKKLGTEFFGDTELKSIVTATGMTMPTEYNFDQHGK